MKWEYKTLDQLGTVSRGKSKHRPRNDPKLFGGKYPFIQTADVKNADYYITKYSDTYNESGLAQSKLWDKGTLCITIAANIADTGVLAFPACFPDSIMGFVPFEGVANTRFIKYCFDRLQRDCKQISQGTAQDNLSWEKLSTIKFCIPEYKEQCRIADILSAYDDLIENNQKQIKLLEEAARRLYKEWFVDLRFPGHENTKIVDGVPEGWQYEKLGDLVKTTSGGTPSRRKSEYYVNGNIRWIKTKELNDRFIFETEEHITEDAVKNSSAKVLPEGALIVAMYGATIGKIGITAAEMACNQACCAFISFDDMISKEYLYCWLMDNREYLVSQGKGAAQSNLSQEMIRNFSLLCPDKKVIKNFTEIVTTMLENKRVLENKILMLSKARDDLLPKLMSGEVEV